jgi:heme/copper-type cytochrome/quinol oxidase subunit 2
MSARHGIQGVAIVAAVLVALSFAGVGSDLTTGIFWNIDGLLLLSVCLLMVLVFGAMLFFLFKTQKVEEAAPTAAAKPAAAAAAAKPAPPAAPINRAAATPTPAVTAANSAEQGQPAKIEKTAVANPSQTAPQK